jgi:hypothetical protein
MMWLLFSLTFIIPSEKHDRRVMSKTNYGLLDFGLDAFQKVVICRILPAPE